MAPDDAISLTARLSRENETLRRRLAHMTAQHIWVEGGGYAAIDHAIREFGYRLDAVAGDGLIPRIIPLEGKRPD